MAVNLWSHDPTTVAACLLTPLPPLFSPPLLFTLPIPLEISQRTALMGTHTIASSGTRYLFIYFPLSFSFGLLMSNDPQIFFTQAMLSLWP